MSIKVHPITFPKKVNMSKQKATIYLKTVAWLIVVSASLSGCSIGYYAQSVSGQLDLMWKREPISELLKKDSTPLELKSKLEQVLQIRQFASDQLHLPKNDSYKTYVQLDRNYVVWNVVAAPEFSLQLDHWCFLIVGCVNYRGYYHEQDAQAFGDKLRKQGQDVYVYGVDAYSTLGWFNDPMLSTVINRSEPRLAGLVFHELAHQLLFIKNDSAFDESFAKTVEIEGVKRWMQYRGKPQLTDLYLLQKQREDQFVALVHHTADKLRGLYEENIPEATMRERKAAVFQEMRQQYAQLKADWDGYSGYDAWFASNLNNAKLGTIGVYRDLVPAFQALLRQQHGDLQAFYAAARQLSKLPKEQRDAELDKLAHANG